MLTVALLAAGGCADDDPPAADATTSGPATTTTAAPIDAPGRLLFNRFIEQSHTFDGMFTARPDGSDEVSVPLPGPEGGGGWSHSGASIAVMTVLPDDRIGTAILAPDGALLRELEIPDPTLNLVCTVWSPDDLVLACEGFDDAEPTRNGIYSVSAADGSSLQRLTTPAAGMRDDPGDFAPDGRLVFKRFAGDEAPGPLMVLDASGETTVLTDLSVEDAGRFDPLGEQVVTSAGGHVIVLDLNGAVTTEISDGSAFLFGPDWSPDGAWIAFSKSVSGPFADIWITRPDGTDAHRVTSTPDNEIGVDWGVDALG